MINNLYVCGDVHGMYKKFIDVFNQIKLDDNDKMIFLGDYIDRGEECLEMMKFVVDNIDNEKMIFLKGNHEDMMIEDFITKIEEIYGIGNLDVKTFLKYIDKDVLESLLHDGSPKYIWVQNGGSTTIKAMLKDIVLAKQYILCSLHMQIKIDIEYKGNLIHFSHAGCNALKSESNQTDYDYIWSRESFYDYYQGKNLWVVGHTPIQCFTDDDVCPLMLENNILMCDTGSYLDEGRISIVNLKTNKVYQDNVNEKAPTKWMKFMFQ